MAYEDFQYNSCVSRGICSINPQTSALQTVMVIYIKYFAIFSKSVNISDDIKEIILNIIATTIYNLEYNESTFLNSLKIFKKILPNMMECTFEDCFVDNIEEVKNKVNECFNETSDIISAIKYGEKIFNNVQENISPERRDLYNILLVVAKSLSINLLELISYQKDNSEAFNVILGLFNAISSNKSEIDNLKLRISEAAKVDIGLMKELRDVQEERYGIQRPVEVSYTTSPNKAVLVAGASIKELENILEALKEENIDIYTHDEMMLGNMVMDCKIVY